MIGDNIRKALEHEGISSNELAEKIGLSATYVSYLLNNKRKPSLKTLNKIADVLNVSVSELTKELQMYNDNILDKEMLSRFGPIIIKSLVDFSKSNSDISAIVETLRLKDKFLYGTDIFTEIICDLKAGKIHVQLKDSSTVDLIFENDSSLKITNYSLKNSDEVNEPNVDYVIDEDMKAIIETLKNASPNKKAKILATIKLFEDEK